MKPTIRTLRQCGLVLLLMAAAAKTVAEDQPLYNDDDVGREITRLIRVSADSSVIATGSDTIGELARNTTSLSGYEINIASVNALEKTRRGVDTWIVDMSAAIAEPDLVRVPMEEVPQIIAHNIQAALERVTEVVHEQAVSELNELVQSEERYRAQLADITATRSALLAQIAPFSPNADELQRQEQHMLERIHELELELPAMEARAAALAREIDRRSQKLEARTAEDPAMREMEHVVAIREEAVANARRLAENGSFGQHELAEITEQLARAKIELATRREQCGAEIRQSLIPVELELSQIAIDRAAQEVDLQQLRNSLEILQSRDVWGLVQKYEFEVELPMQSLRRSLHVAADRRFEVEELVRQIKQPRVTVYEPAAAKK